jgi:hypothetical protein
MDGGAQLKGLRTLYRPSARRHYPDASPHLQIFVAAIVGDSVSGEKTACCIAQINCADIGCHRCGKTSNLIPADCSLVRSAFPIEDAVVTWPELGGRSSYAKHKAASLIILEVSV